MTDSSVNAAGGPALMADPYAANGGAYGVAPSHGQQAEASEGPRFDQLRQNAVVLPAGSGAAPQPASANGSASAEPSPSGGCATSEMPDANSTPKPTDVVAPAAITLEGGAPAEDGLGRTKLAGRGVSDAPPPPPPAITDATPDVWFHEFQKARQEEHETKEEERLAQLQQKKEEKKGGVGYKIGKFFSNAGAGVSSMVHDATESREMSVWDANMKRARERMRKYWPHQPEEGFIVEYDCFGLHNNQPTRGHLLLTRTSLLFLGKGPHELVVVEDIPLSDIVSYSKGVSVPAVSKDCRWVMDLPNNYAVADAIQIYMRQGVLFHFMDFTHSILRSSTSLPGTYISDGHDEVLAYDRFINYLDHAWRSSQEPHVAEGAPVQQQQ